MGIRLGRKVYQPFPGTIRFMCPGCDSFHQIQVDGSRGWTWNGDADCPTVSPSIAVSGKRKITDDEHARIMAGEKVSIPDAMCHSFIKDGQWQFLSDCTHSLAGQTVDLPDWPNDHWSE
ncbi:MAG: DUF6527 family protein [Bosea sp. (in: a-proteobacteria)]